MNNFIISGFSDEIAADFQTQLKEMKALDISYIEIRGVNGKNITDHTLEEVKQIKKALDDASIQVSAIGSPIGKIHIEDDFEPHFELFKHTIEIARLLNTKYIRFFSFFMEASDAQKYRDEVMNRMSRFIEYVKGTDMMLLHENEKDIYGDTPERCLDLIRSLSSPNLKLIFDPANYIQCHVETYPHAFHLLKDEVIYYHIKDAIAKTGEVVPSGYGDGQIKAIIKELYARNYKGFLSIEPHLGNFEGFEQLAGDKGVPEFKEKSDVSKFQLAATSLREIILKVQNG